LCCCMAAHGLDIPISSRDYFAPRRYRRRLFTLEAQRHFPGRRTVRSDPAIQQVEFAPMGAGLGRAFFVRRAPKCAPPIRCLGIFVSRLVAIHIRNLRHPEQSPQADASSITGPPRDSSMTARRRRCSNSLLGGAEVPASGAADFIFLRIGSRDGNPPISKKVPAPVSTNRNSDGSEVHRSAQSPNCDLTFEVRSAA